MTRSSTLSSLVLVSALMLSACASHAPQYPVRPAAPAPLPAPPVASPPATPLPSPYENGATPAPSTSVQAAPLPPIGGSRQNTAPTQNRTPTAQPLPPIGGATPALGARLTPAPPPALETPRQVTVGQGETLFDVAERVRTPVRAIIELNNLQPPYALQPGSSLKIPPPLVYVVGAGDTLFGIARRFSIDPRSLANLNDFPMETAIRPGQRIALPSLARDGGSAPGASGASPQGTSQLAATTPARPVVRSTSGAVVTPMTPAAPVAAPAPMSDAAVAAAGRGRFTWPLKGEVLSKFGPQGPGQRNDGLNIAAQPGTAVHAAAAGEVVFAGQLPGFGNLVLLKHTGGWVTAYAHLSKLEVKMRDTVMQNQEVGESGQTGQVDRPQLHFEVRYAPNPKDKARPVDPSLLLPG